MTRTSTQLLTLGVALGVALATLVSVARTATAQADPVKLLAVPSALNGPGSLGDMYRAAPGTNSGTPLAFGPAMGDFFIGGGWMNKTRNYKLYKNTFGPDGVDDGSISMGFGLGDANDVVGLATVITSLSTFRAGLGAQAAVSFQLFHNFDPTLAVAIGAENAAVSGGAKNATSWYGVASKVFVQPVKDFEYLKALTVSGGLGNGRFRLITDANLNRKKVNAFASVAAQVHDQLSINGDYTGQDINVGASVVPFRKFPIAITPAIVDITGTANPRPRFTIGASYGVHF